MGFDLGLLLGGGKVAAVCICFVCKKILCNPIACDLGCVLCSACNEAKRGLCGYGKRCLPLTETMRCNASLNVLEELRKLVLRCCNAKYGCNYTGRPDYSLKKHSFHCTFNPTLEPTRVWQECFLENQNLEKRINNQNTTIVSLRQEVSQLQQKLLQNMPLQHKLAASIKQLKGENSRLRTNIRKSLNGMADGRKTDEKTSNNRMKDERIAQLEAFARELIFACDEKDKKMEILEEAMRHVVAKLFPKEPSKDGLRSSKRPVSEAAEKERVEEPAVSNSTECPQQPKRCKNSTEGEPISPPSVAVKKETFDVYEISKVKQEPQDDLVW